MSWSSLHKRTWLFLLVPVLVYFAAFFIYPMYNLVSNSVTTQSGVLTAANFSQLLKDPYLPTILEVTLFFVVGTVALQMLAGVSLALLINSLPGKIRGAMQMVVIVPLMLPPVVTGLLWLLLYDKDYGPGNFFLAAIGLGRPDWLGNFNLALLSVVITEVWRYSPFVFLIVFAGLQSVHPQLYEAAMVDGSSSFQTFRYITLPMLRSSLVVAFILDAIGALKGFDIIYVLTNGGPGLSTMVLSLYIYTVAFVFNNAHYAAAISVIFLAIVLAFVLVMIRFTSVEEYLGLKKGGRK